MSQYRPSINDLILTVQQFLNEAGKQLQGEAKYHALVSSYLLGICERELRLAPAFDDQEAKGLAKFLGASGNLDELQKELRTRVRSGKTDNQWDELLDMALTQTVNNVSVVRPDHLAAMHRK